MSNPSYEELQKKVQELEGRLDKQGAKGLTFKIGEKGGVSVYGLGRFPVTLYFEQWIKLLDASDDLRTFLEENKSRLKLKEAK